MKTIDKYQHLILTRRVKPLSKINSNINLRKLTFCCNKWRVLYKFVSKIYKSKMTKELPLLLSNTQTEMSGDTKMTETEKADWFINSVKKKHLDTWGNVYYYKIEISVPFPIEFRIQNNISSVIINNQEITDTINLSYFAEGHVNMKQLDIHDKNILFNKFFMKGEFKYSFNNEFGHFIVDHNKMEFKSIFQIYQHLIKFTVEILLADYFQSTRRLQFGTTWD